MAVRCQKFSVIRKLMRSLFAVANLLVLLLLFCDFVFDQWLLWSWSLIVTWLVWWVVIGRNRVTWCASEPFDSSAARCLLIYVSRALSLSLSLCTGRTERLISSVKAAEENFMLPWPNAIDVEEDGQRYQPDRHGSCVVHHCLRSCNISVLL